MEDGAILCNISIWCYCYPDGDNFCLRPYLWDKIVFLLLYSRNFFYSYLEFLYLQQIYLEEESYEIDVILNEVKNLIYYCSNRVRTSHFIRRIRSFVLLRMTNVV